MAEKQVIFFNISGEKVEAKYDLKDISFFKLDLSNPRFNHLKLVSDKEEEERIWKDKDTKLLFDSIVASKGISEPVVAKEDGLVIEGNRRIVCIRKIKEKFDPNSDFSKDVFEKIPTYIFSKNISPMEQSVYLARLHVSGKKEWDAFNQAKYINMLKDKFELTFDKISALIGMSKGKVIQKYWAFTETQKFLEVYNDETIGRYSFFEEAYKKKNIKEFLENEANKGQFYKWIISGKLKGAKDIRQLSEIKDDEKFFALFKKEGITEAYHNYQSVYKIKGKKDNKLILDLITMLKNIPREELKELTKDKEKIILYKDLKKEIESLLDEIKKIK